jgi:hypothetical protein
MADRYQVKGRRIWDRETDTYSKLFQNEGHARHIYNMLLCGKHALKFQPLAEWQDDKPESDPVEQPASDPVNHPDHYQGKVECIDAIEAALGIDGFIDHCRGTAMKYIYRAGRKNNSKRSKKKYLKGKDTTVQDLEKGVWYLQRAINAIKQERGT